VIAHFDELMAACDALLTLADDAVEQRSSCEASTGCPWLGRFC
jgi:hypothetical protein